MPGMSELYLVRHGQASFGSEDYDRLSGLGREQARLLGQHFAALGRRVDAIYSGPLRRQHATAQIVAETLAARGGVHVPVVVLEELAEYDADPLIEAYVSSGRAGPSIPPRAARALQLTRAEYQKLLEETGRAWLRGELADAGLESWPEFRARVARGIERICRSQGRGRSVLAASSAGVIGAVLGQLLELAHERALAASWVVFNGAVTHVRFDERRLTLASFNGVAHLEVAGRPELLTYR